MIKFTKLKNKNKNGFAMAELLAVCIVVLTIFTILFSNYLPLVAEYENRSVYNNVTAQYAAHHFRKAYAEAIAHTATKPDNQNIEKTIASGCADDGFITVYEKNNGNVTTKTILDHVNSSDKEEIAKLLNEYDVEEIIVTPYKLETLKENYPNTGKLYGYIKYLPTYKNHNDNGKEAYRIIIKSSEFGYATTPIKYENVSSGEQDPNHPVLSDNMIPVTYLTGTEGSVICGSSNPCWAVVSDDETKKSDWYDYDEGEWANSITVKEDARYKYINDDGTYREDTPIEMADVLTMQVWIPRFNYEVWNYNKDGTTTANLDDAKYVNLGKNGITINFEDAGEKGDITCTPKIQGEKGDGTSEECFFKGKSCNDDNENCNGETYTHPAFTFDGNNLSGFWVGKFELSSDISCTTTNGVEIGVGCNLTTINPLVKPNVRSWRGAMISVFEDNIIRMSSSNNEYGFVAQTDKTHMIKNMEWGAVVYLSHSKYGTCSGGKCNEVKINAYTGQRTGCGSTSDVCDPYDAGGIQSSTTGNIYGIYDMNGGTSEYVMGNMIYDPDEEIIMVGQKVEYAMLSGYNGMLFDELGTGEFIEYKIGRDHPGAQYVDMYSFSNGEYIRKNSKLGDGIKETMINAEKSWDNDKTSTLYAPTGRVWYTRGGEYDDAGEAGIFQSFADTGYASRYYTSRLAIAVLEE